MTRSEVSKVLNDLANGTNPITGGPLPSASPYHEPQVIRALFVAARLVEQFPKPRDKSQLTAENAGQPWSIEEDERLIREFDARLRFSAIAKSHSRTRGGILARLVRLGKLAARDDSTPASEVNAPLTSNWALLKRQRTQAGKVWTAAEDAALIRDYDAGVPAEHIAERLHRGVHAVQVRLIKLGRNVAATSS